MHRSFRGFTLAVLALIASSATAAGIERDDRLAARLQTEEARLRAERAAYPDYFEQAYARYPAIPRGALEAIAHVQSRWQHLTPRHADSHRHMPRAYGVMGLYHGGGFADQVGEAARLLGVPVAAVEDDPLANVLGAAALLDRALGGERPRTIEDIAPVLADYAGFAPARGEIQAFARASFAFDVLLTLDRGVNDRGVRVPERPIRWERAFDADLLARLGAPFLRLDVQRDRIETGDYVLDPRTEKLLRKQRPGAAPSDIEPYSTDYGPALWVPSPYHSSRTSTSAVTIHTAQGSYAGTISWFQSNPYSVSAHYVIRSSDGQVTQMVRENRAAHHVRSHNSTTLGIEHEGFVDDPDWYTAAMYDASSALVRHFCARYGAIDCASAYDGPAHGGVVVLPDSVRIKGHQHFSGQTHTDPGIHWNWAQYYGLLNPSSGGTTVLDSFESSAGHFNTSPTYSGSTVGISTGSTALRTCSVQHDGSCSLHVKLLDDPGSSLDWAVRLLSGAGSPGSNVPLSRDNGRIGFWIYSGGSGMSVAVGIDDSDGTERSTSRAVPANQWTYLEWALEDAAQWNAWAGGNGAITAGSVTLDAVWIYRAQTSYTVNLYLDEVQIAN